MAKSLDCSVVKKLVGLEKEVYKYTDLWKKKYRYTLIDEFRKHITDAKNNTIIALELSNRSVENKLSCYECARIELVLAESNMDTMIDPEIAVMSEKEWVTIAEMMNEIHAELMKLYNKFNRK